MPNPTAALDPHSVSQGNIQNVSDLAFGAPTGDAVTITSAGLNIPVMKDREYFEVRNHPQATNNGLYRVDDTAPAAGTTDVRKVSGANPITDTARDCDVLATLITPGTVLTDGNWNNASGETVDIVSAGGNLPSLFVGSRFFIENHTSTENNGGYEVLSTVTNGYNCQKLTGANPSTQAAEAVDCFSEQKSYFYDTAALGMYVLEQPGLVSTAVSDAVWGTPTGALVQITSAGNNLPAVKIGQKINVWDHLTAANNGDYVVKLVTTINADITCEMVSDGVTPASAASDAVTMLTDPLVDDTGVFGQPLYSRLMIDWNDDNFLRNNAGFPLFNIDSDAGKYLMGQNAAGVNHGANWVDNAEFGIRSRKMLHNMGWQEINSAGLVTAEWAAIRSNATTEDPDRDLSYYQFGTDTEVDDTVDFEFAGPVDESILCYDATVTRVDDYAVSGTNTITRSDGGDFVLDGYKVGGSVVIENAEDPANDGTHVITSIVGGINGSITMTGSTLTNNLNDTTMTMAVDNRFAFSLKLRPRDDDALGKSFAQAGLAAALATQLSNRAFVFGVGTVEDANITNTDATVSAYGVTITFHSTPQSLGGATLVGGARNFGITVAGNAKTATEIYEYIEYALRQITDIDAGAGTVIGRTMDGMARFNGSVLEFGSTDGGLTFPTNPLGGGSGIFATNVAAADANNVKFFDNLGVLRTNKETIAVTLDANETLNNDTVGIMDLWYDRTIRNNIAGSDFIVTAGAGSIGTLNSAGGNLPGSLDGGVGSYIRVGGLTGGDAAMNGLYQVTSISTTQYDVTRYDTKTIVTTSAASGVNIDEHPYDSPDSIVVDTNNLLTATTISFTTDDTIGDTGSGLAIFSIGDRVRIEGAGAGTNAGKIVTVLTVAAGTITIELSQFDPVIDTQAAGGSVTLTQVATVKADDFAFSYGFDDVVQGGRVISTPTFVKAKAIGRQTAQFTESSVLSIVSQTPLTVPLQAQTERNVTGVS